MKAIQNPKPARGRPSPALRFIRWMNGVPDVERLSGAAPANQVDAMTVGHAHTRTDRGMAVAIVDTADTAMMADTAVMADTAAPINTVVPETTTAATPAFLTDAAPHTRAENTAVRAATGRPGKKVTAASHPSTAGQSLRVGVGADASLWC